MQSLEVFKVKMRYFMKHLPQNRHKDEFPRKFTVNEYFPNFLKYPHYTNKRKTKNQVMMLPKSIILVISNY